MKDLSIGNISKQAGLSASTIRYYESAGLLAAPPRTSGQRRYDSDIVKRLIFIKLAQKAGFSVVEIKTLLEGFQDNTPPVSQWRKLAAEKIIEIEEIIHRAQQMKELLAEGLRCGCLNFDECYTIINSKESL